MVHGRIGNGNCSCGSRHDSKRISAGGRPEVDSEARAAIKEAERRKKARQVKLW